jgi:pullulanase
VNPANGTPPGQLGFIINNCNEGGVKDPGPNQYLQVTQNLEAWVISGNPNVYLSLPTPAEIASAGLYTLGAFWIDRTTVAIPAAAQSGWSYSLLYSLSAGLSVTSTGSIAGGTAIPMTLASGGFTSAEKAQYPQLAGYTVLHIPTSVPVSTLKQALTGQLVVQATDSSGNLAYISGIQDAGVLDDLFYYPGHLGTAFDNGGLSVSLWAPTAQSVNLLLYANENDTTPAETVAMTEVNGVWTFTTSRFTFRRNCRSSRTW